jgi:ankyrin repeat domain-containing protein 50
MQALARKHNIKDIRALLDDLSGELPNVYEKLMQRFWSQEKEDVDLGSRVLAWVSYSTEPMTLERLQSCMARKPGSMEVDSDALTDPGRLISSCIGLVEYDEETEVVRFAHHTFPEYIRKIDRIRFGVPEETFVVASRLGYVSSVHASWTDGEQARNALHENSLFQYCVQHWSDHARLSKNPTIQSLIFDFLSEKRNRAFSVRALEILLFIDRVEQYAEEVPELCVVAAFGLTTMVSFLLDQGYDVKAVDSRGRTALHWAVMTGREDVVDVLLTVAEINARDGEGRTALHHAAREGHADIARLLLYHNADIDGIDTGGNTALDFARMSKNANTTELLLSYPERERRSLAVTSRDSERNTGTTFSTFWTGVAAVSRMLSLTKPDNDAEVSHDNDSGKTALDSKGRPEMIPTSLPTTRSQQILKAEAAEPSPHDWIIGNQPGILRRALIARGAYGEVHSVTLNIDGFANIIIDA